MKKKKFNHELIRNAEQFLKDLNNAKKYKDEMREIDARYYETPKWFQNTYNQAMQDLGRWLVKNDNL